MSKLVKKSCRKFYKRLKNNIFFYKIWNIFDLFSNKLRKFSYFVLKLFQNCKLQFVTHFLQNGKIFVTMWWWTDSAWGSRTLRCATVLDEAAFLVVTPFMDMFIMCACVVLRRIWISIAWCCAGHRPGFPSGGGNQRGNWFIFWGKISKFVKIN